MSTYNVTLYRAQYEVMIDIIETTICDTKEESIAKLCAKYPHLKTNPLIDGVVNNAEGLLMGLEAISLSNMNYCKFLVGSLLTFTDTHGAGYNLAVLVLLFYTNFDTFKSHYNKTPNIAVIYELAHDSHLVICNQSSCTKIVN